MIDLLLLSLILAVISGVIFVISGEDDNPFVFFIGIIVLIMALLCALATYNMHNDKILNYETKVPAQIDTTIRINPDKSMDTTYLYHFPKE